MMRAALCLAASAALSGCAAVLSESELRDYRPVAAAGVPTVTITWIAVDNAEALCRRMTAGADMKTAPLACAIWNTEQTRCTIITADRTANIVVGHEVRHCFEGAFHK